MKQHSGFLYYTGDIYLMTVEEIHWYEWGLYHNEWNNTSAGWEVVNIIAAVQDFIQGKGIGNGGGSIGGAGLPLGVGIIDPGVSIVHSGKVGFRNISGKEIFGRNLTKLESRQFINLVCKVNGLTIEEVKERINSELTLLELQKTIDHVLGTSVTLKSIG